MARNNRNGTPRRSRGKSSNGRRNNNSNKGKDTPKSKKTLADHMYYVGSTTNASDCVVNTNFILNYIELEFPEGLDIATALKNGEDYDFDAERPMLQTSEADPDKEKAKYEREKEQFQLEFNVKFDRFHKREEQYRINKNAAAALFWKQCSSGMGAKLQARTDFKAIEKKPI